VNGPKGTGKTLIAQSLAQRLNLPLYRFNLHHYTPEQYRSLLQLLRTLPPCITLIEPCSRWLGRRSPLLSLGLQEWLHSQSRKGQWVIAEGEFAVPLSLSVRPFVDDQITLTLPDATARLQLWKQAFAREMALDLSVDWHSFWAKLAHQYRLSGAQITQLAREAGHQAQAAGDRVIMPRHLHNVLRARKL
jgi:AAA+ superfamily predicted ATPase